jgi:hypothetical protein
MAETILSLFDFSGEWSAPYLRAGYEVIRVDIKLGTDILNWDGWRGRRFHGVLAAPPCTDFSSSGARWWAGKDASGETEASIRLVLRTMEIIHSVKPAWWALENPVGRIGSLVPMIGPVRMRFHPCHYGDPHTKLTCLWGDFNTNLPRTDVEPVLYTTSKGKRGSYYWAKFGGKSERTKAARSQTPAGFSRAFFEANP